MTQQALRRHDDERLARAALELAAEGVEILPRGGEIAHLHVPARAELQEALQPGARVFRALAFVAVWQKERDVTWALPLALRTGDELVDDDLRSVDEVSELRLPANQEIAGEQ